MPSWRSLQPASVDKQHRCGAWCLWSFMVCGLALYTITFICLDIITPSPYITRIGRTWGNFLDLTISPPIFEGVEIKGTFLPPKVEIQGTSWADYYIQGDTAAVAHASNVGQDGYLNVKTSLLKPKFPKSAADPNWVNELIVSIGFKVDDFDEKKSEAKFDISSYDTHYDDFSSDEAWEVFWDRLRAQVIRPSDKNGNFSVERHEFSIDKVTKDFYKDWDYPQFFTQVFSETKMRNSKKPSSREEPTQRLVDVANMTDDNPLFSSAAILFVQFSMSVVDPNVMHYEMVPRWKQVFHRISAVGGLSAFIAPIFGFFYVLSEEQVPTRHFRWASQGAEGAELLTSTCDEDSE